MNDAVFPFDKTPNYC